MGGGKRKSLKPFNVDQSSRIKRFEVFALLREKKGEYKCGGAVTVVLRYSLITTGPRGQGFHARCYILMNITDGVQLNVDDPILKSDRNY